MHKTICLLFFFSAIFSCKEKIALKYAELYFPETITLQGEICNDNFLFNSPHGILATDSLLILYDNNYDGIVHVFSKAGGYIRSGVKKGRGPGEIITLGSFDIFENKLLICDPSLNRLIVYNLNRIVNDLTPYYTEEYTLFNDSYWIRQAKWYKDGSIAIKGYSDNLRFGFIDGEKVISTYCKFPDLVLDQEENRSIWEYEVQWKFKPDYSKMVTTTYIGSLMEILNSENITYIESEKLLPIHKPKYTLAQGAKPKWITSSDNTTIGFLDLFVTDSHIYALIYGVNINDLETNLPSIYVLSWDGIPKVKYQFEERIWTFCVDEEEESIYAIASDDTNLSLRKYSLPSTGW